MKRLAAWLSATLIRFISATLRLSLEDHGGILNRPNHPPVIIAFWHNRMALMASFSERFCRQRTVLTFISRSRDGQFMTDVAAQFGIQAVRGSSSRHGASAALAAIHAANDPQVDLVITPDGPRGPCYEVQPGLLRLARQTGRPIVAINYQLKWKYQLKSWDRFFIPLPFSSCHLVTSEPIHVPENAIEEELDKIKLIIAEKLGSDM
ncbi:MAG: lysophospholipid acyltransferase family protein [Methylacidiphilales bacterium]|nr:lysophospholipid acyltransferase family protein [Candidatus Methylacidiphilales bacterium]